MISARQFLLMRILFVGLISSLLTGAAPKNIVKKIEKKPNTKFFRSSYIKNIYKACVKKASEMEKKSSKNERWCKCISENFDIKLDDSDIKTLLVVYKSEKKPTVEFIKTNDRLLDFDISVAMRCKKNSKWRITQAPKKEELPGDW